MTYTDLREQGLLDELARLANDHVSSRHLLEDAGMPPGKIPPFNDAPVDYWRSVCRTLDDLVEDGNTKLIRAAAKHFEGNEAFQTAAASFPNPTEEQGPASPQ